MAISTSSKIGANFGVQTSTAQFGLGDTAIGTQDSMWVYCEIVGAASTGKICQISTAGTAAPCLTSAGQSSANSLIAFTQSAWTSGQFGWMVTRGNNVYVAASGTIAPSGVLYVAATTGLVHTTSASSTLAGVVLITQSSASATANVVLANLTWPRFVTNLG